MGALKILIDDHAASGAQLNDAVAAASAAMDEASINASRKIDATGNALARSFVNLSDVLVRRHTVSATSNDEGD